MKKIVSISIIVIVLLILLFACIYRFSYPPLKSQLIEDTEDYLKVNSYVSDYINHRYSGILPSKEKVLSDNCSYHYEYSCAIFGDPQFIVYCRMNRADSSLRSSEAERISNLPACKIIEDKGETIYYIQLADDQKKLIDQYLDDEVLDGMSYTFEMAIIDDKAESIEYLFANQWDYQRKSSYILRFVEPLKSAEK